MGVFLHGPGGWGGQAQQDVPAALWAAPALIFRLDSPLPGRGRGRTFRVNEKYQKVTQGTTFLENPPSLRGLLVCARGTDCLV